MLRRPQAEEKRGGKEAERLGGRGRGSREHQAPPTGAENSRRLRNRVAGRYSTKRGVKPLQETGQEAARVVSDSAARPCRDGTHQPRPPFPLSAHGLSWSSVEEEASPRPAASPNSENERLKCKPCLPAACARGKLLRKHFSHCSPGEGLFCGAPLGPARPELLLCSFVRFIIIFFYFTFQIGQLRLREGEDFRWCLALQQTGPNSDPGNHRVLWARFDLAEPLLVFP